MMNMTDAQIAAYVFALGVCYFAGLKIGKVISILKGLGNST